jgi:hypothetical protein
MQLFRRNVLPKITTLPLRKTGGNFSRFKKRCDGGPFYLKRRLVVVLKSQSMAICEFMPSPLNYGKTMDRIPKTAC